MEERASSISSAARPRSWRWMARMALAEQRMARLAEMSARSRAAILRSKRCWNSRDSDSRFTDSDCSRFAGSAPAISRSDPGHLELAGRLDHDVHQLVGLQPGVLPVPESRRRPPFSVRRGSRCREAALLNLLNLLHLQQRAHVQ